MKRLMITFVCVLTAITSNAAEPNLINDDYAVNEAASMLIAARVQNKLIELPTSLKPRTLEDGYKIQDKIIQDITIKQKGWKVAITSKELMTRAGVQEPISGPLFEQWSYPEPHTINNGSPTLYGFEFEFAFQIAKDLPPRKQPYNREEVLAAVGSLHLAIEPVGSRYIQGPVKSGIGQFAADHGGNYGFVYGPSISNWQSINLSKITVTGYFNNKKIGQESGANVMGDPVNSLIWLTNHLPQRGHYLKAGQWVTTGAVVGPVSAKPPVKVRGDFGPLGNVHVNFEG
ncbi:2-keto-4-pentenoate hydratase [Vibrio campbellii]|uniref:2-keto-4-pentenoate hydratase n=1 Tax=Vibrio campbellii TaxID=680 RepID=UPI0005EF9BD3|nr:hypothetical protein [Vibrio campbellii]